MNGVLLVDKPRGPTSHDVVRWARKAFGTRSVGHAGTLDPMATGVLVVAIGEGTKLVPYLMAGEKRYEAEITLGVETDTLDAMGEEIGSAEVPAGLADDDVRRALESFGGGYDQQAPAVSALKRGGRTLHSRVRAGEQVEAPVRRVTIHSLELREFDGRRARVAVHCGKGFYVRSLARDLAVRLGSVGHLSALRRTASGDFAVDRCVDGDALREAAADPSRRSALVESLLSLEEATAFLPSLFLDEEGRADAYHGRPVLPSRFSTRGGAPPSTETSVRMLDSSGQLVAIGEVTGDGRARVVRGFRRESPESTGA